MNIQQIIDKVNDYQLFVPAFQREYVWKRKDAKALFESLIKKYPTGTLLTWDTTQPPELKGVKKYNPQMGSVKLILDGQQRVTTFYMIMTGNIPPYYNDEEIKHNVRNLHVNLLSMELEYYKPTVMENNPLWVNLTDIFKGNVLVSDLFNILSQHPDLKSKIDKILSNLEAIKSIKDREFTEQSIPVTASIKDAIDIFYIVNASGVSLTDAELALAQVSGYWPQARDVFKKKITKLSKDGFVLKLDFIVYSLLAVLYHMGSDMKKLHGKENLERIQKAWKRLDEKVLDYVMSIMKSHAFVDHSSEINSIYALIPIIVYVDNKPNTKLSLLEIKKAIKWFYYSQIRYRYISQLPQKLDKDIGIVANSISPFDDLLAQIKAERPLEISKDEFVGTSVRSPLFNLMKWYFKSKNAICLGTGLEIRRNMGEKYELENDHIFAYSVLRDEWRSMKNKINYALAQEITNRVILTKLENREKSAQYADIYLRKANTEFPNALALQCIPENENLWKVENYEDFLKKRREILADEFNKYLNAITETKLNGESLSIEDMIEEGESQFLEFKSSLRWNYEHSVIDKRLEGVILKSIAAFNNAKGGILMIGVSDEGEILGLEPDYDTFKEGNNKDVFERHLRNLINNSYSTEYATNKLTITFPKVGDKEICVIEIDKGTSPLYTIVHDIYTKSRFGNN